MAGFDDPGVYYSDSLFSEDRSESLELTRTAAQKRFKDFIKTFIDHQNCFCYRYYKQLFLINTSSFLIVEINSNAIITSDSTG